MKVLITGGASGLGRAITEQLAAQPAYQVCFTYHRSEAQAKEIQSKFPNTESKHCDFQNETSVTQLCDHIRTCEPDVLIHNAYTGNYLGTHFHKTPAEDFLRDFTANLLPIINITQAAIDVFRKQKKGKIITVLTAALQESPATGASVYIAGKAYLQALAKSWAAENEKFNLKSILVLPAMMETNLTASIDERIKDQLRSQEKLGRFLRTNEAALAILRLCESASIANAAIVELRAGTDLNTI